MAKNNRKPLSILLAAMMVVSMCSVPVASVSAAEVDTENSEATTAEVESSAGLASKYSTNKVGVGSNKTISVDGDLSDWNSSMLIAQGAANDDPRVYRPNSMYEIPYDCYALYGAWDDTNLYLMVEMTNVQDVVAPNDDYPMGSNVTVDNIPMMFYIDTGKSDSIGNNGLTQKGDYIWNLNTAVSNPFNRVAIMATGVGKNGPYIYGGDSTGINPVELGNSTTSGIVYKTGKGILSKEVWGIDGAYGANNNRVVGDISSDSSNWVDFNTKGHNSATMDFNYEISIPLTQLGITKSDIENNGVGVLYVLSGGASGMDCLPYDATMNDNADLGDAVGSHENNSFEKSDEDNITTTFARVGKNGGTPQPTQPTTPTEEPTSAPVGVTGRKTITANAGDIIDFSVKTTTSKKVSAYTLTTNYDSAGLELYKNYSEDGVSTYASDSGKGTEVINVSTAGKVKSAVLAQDNAPYTFTSATKLQTIQFKAKKSGTYTISYVLDEMLDNNSNDLVTGGRPVSGVTMSADANIESETPTSAPTGGIAASKKVTMKAGDVLTFAVKAKSSSSLNAYRMTTTYNSSGLELDKTYSGDGVTTLSSTTGKGTEVVNTSTAGTIKTAVLAAANSPYAVSTTKNIQTIKLKAKKAGTYTISYTIDELVDQNNNDLIVGNSLASGTTITMASSISGASSELSLSSFTVSPATITLGETVTLKAQVSGGKADYTYLLKGNGNRIVQSTTSEKTFTKTWKPSKTGTYNLEAIVTDANGKSVSKTITLKVNAASGALTMTSFAVSPTTVTLGETVTLKAQVSGGKANYTYLLKGNGNRIVQSTTSSKTFTKAWKPSKTGTYNLEAVVTDANGNSVSKKITLNVKAASGALTMTSFTVSPTTITLGETVTLKAQVSGGKANYTYLLKGNGNRIVQSTTSEKTFTKTWKPSKTGTYNLEAVVTDANGNSVSKKITLNVKAASGALTMSSFTVSPATITLGETVTLKAQVSGGKANYTYLLKGNGNRIVQSTTSEKTFTKTWKPSKTGTYNLEAVVTDANGNSVSKKITLNVKAASGALTMSSFTVSPATITLGETVTLKAQVSGGKANYTYLLKGNGNRIVQSTTSNKTFTKTWKPSKTGTYNLEAVVTDANGNSVSKKITLNVKAASNELTIKSFAASATSVNVGTSITFATIVDGGKADYTYLLKGNGNRIVQSTTSEKIFSKSWKPSKAGTYKIELVVTDANGNSVSKTITVTVK